VEEAFTFWGTPEGDLVHPADCMEQLLEKVRRHRVNIDGNVCTVMVTTLVLEVILMATFTMFSNIIWPKLASYKSLLLALPFLLFLFADMVSLILVR
jgi:hypothetical protein